MSAQDPAAFAALLQGLLSSENEVRSQAEQAFTELKKYPDTCVPGLVQGLRSNPDPASRSLCAVLLRKVGVVSTVVAVTAAGCCGCASPS